MNPPGAGTVCQDDSSGDGPPRLATCAVGYDEHRSRAGGIRAVEADIETTWLRLGIALAIGLLIGTEREQRGRPEGQRIAGIRTFSLVALLGGIAAVLESTPLLVVAGASVLALAVAGYALGDRADRGITTEVALQATFLLGALAQRQPVLASGVAVVVTIVLVGRSQLHDFARRLLTEDELHGALLLLAAAGAVLSTVSTILLLAMVLGATSSGVLRAVASPLLLAGFAAVAYGAMFAVRASRYEPSGKEPATGRAFSLKTAVIFALTVSVTTLLAAALHHRYGAAGLVLATLAAGLADTHAAAISTASLVAGGQLEAGAAVVPVLAGLSSNTVSKMVAAFVTGGARFTLQVAPGLLLVLAGAWLGLLVRIP